MPYKRLSKTGCSVEGYPTGCLFQIITQKVIPKEANQQENIPQGVILQENILQPTKDLTDRSSTIMVS